MEWPRTYCQNMPAARPTTPLTPAQVLASYRRLGWAWELPDDYVRDHLIWQRQ